MWRRIQNYSSNTFLSQNFLPLFFPASFFFLQGFFRGDSWQKNYYSQKFWIFWVTKKRFSLIWVWKLKLGKGHSSKSKKNASRVFSQLSWNYNEKKKQQKKQQKSRKILFEFFYFKNSQIHICKKNTHFHNDFPK